MKLLKYLITLSFSALLILLSMLIVVILGEIIFRIKQNGLNDGIKSFFHVEPPNSNLDQKNWMINDPDLGFKLNPSFVGINEYSMREKEIKVPKDINVKRIVILGDSVPFSGDPSFVDLLKKEFASNPEIEILNASTPGYTNYQELIFLKKYILSIQPDLVILCYVLNDNYKFLHKFNSEANILWSEEAENSVFINNKLDRILYNSLFLSQIKARIFSQKKESQLKNSQKWWNSSVDFNTAWKDESWTDVYKQINEMQELLLKINAKFLVVVFPLESQIRSDFLKDNFNEVVKPQAKMIEYGKKKEFPVLDLFMPFYISIDKNKNLKLYTDGLHLSTEGHTLSALEIKKFILDNFRFN